ncbi:MAG: polyprenyl synthetase family protein [Nibricoccus sp.]
MPALHPASDPDEHIIESLRENSPGLAALEPHLAAALTEATAHPGRLLRPRLVHRAALTHGLSDAGALQLACAIEYYHLASLLLDDLPCMDNADTRRGRPCIHRIHGESTAILSALALINRAYALVGFALSHSPAGLRLRAHACLDAALGTAGIIGGQARDLRFSESDRSAREVSIIAAGKTGALLSLAVYFPALLADPSDAELHHLKALCLYWGLAYQASDDLHDVLAGTATTDKTTGRDRMLTRPNLALALGVPAARRRIQRLAGQATSTLHRLSAINPRWEYLAGFQSAFIAPLLSRGAAA